MSRKDRNAMRVGIFTESYEPVKNGVAVSVRTLVDELRLRRHHVCIVAPHYPDYEDEIPFVLRVPSILTPVNAGYPVPYPWFPRLRHDLGNLHLDILHSQTPWFLGLLAARIARQHNIPHVSTYHTLYDHYAHYLFFLPAQATQNLIDWWLPEFYNGCGHVIVPSRVAEDSLRSYGITTPITIIPTGVPLAAPGSMSESARRNARQRFGIPPDAPLLLYVGRIAKEKSVELVVEAFSQIAAEFGEARLLVVGGGPNLDSMKDEARNVPGADRIVFVGPQPHDELGSVYAAADLFVFGSSTETQGLVVGEARAAGTPSVVVNVGGAGETVRDGDDGILVDADASALADGIRKALHDPCRLKRMRQACLRSALCHTPGAMADRVVDVYHAAAEAHVRTHEVTTV